MRLIILLVALVEIAVLGPTAFKQVGAWFDQAKQEATGFRLIVLMILEPFAIYFTGLLWVAAILAVALAVV